EGEFGEGAIRPSQAEAVQAKNAFEVCKQHLDLLPLLPRRRIGLGLRDVAGHVTRAFVYTAWHFACRGVRTTLELQRTGFAVALAGAIKHRVVLRHAASRCRERAAVSAELVSGWTDVGVTLMVIGEVGT